MVSSEDTIAVVKAEINSRTGIGPDLQHLTHLGERLLKDDDTLATLGITEHDMILMDAIP
jgi:hypothetical protein